MTTEEVTVSDQLPLLIRHLLGFYAMETLAMGRTSGALAALADMPGSAAEIAESAGLDERNVGLWLRAMSAAGHAQHDSGRYTFDEETAALLGPAYSLYLGAALHF